MFVDVVAEDDDTVMDKVDALGILIHVVHASLNVE